MPEGVKWVISGIVGLGLIVLGWKVGWVLTTLHVLLCFMLIIVVLLQSGKAADLAGAFGGSGSQTAFGPRGAATFLSKATTWCAVMFMLTSMTLVLRQKVNAPSAGSSVLQEAPAPKPAAPQPQPTSPAPAQNAPAPSTPALPPTPAKK